MLINYTERYQDEMIHGSYENVSKSGEKYTQENSTSKEYLKEIVPTHFAPLFGL